MTILESYIDCMQRGDEAALADLFNEYGVLHDSSLIKAGMDTLHLEGRMAVEMMFHHKFGFNGGPFPIHSVKYVDDNTVWWEGLDKNPPEHAVDWKGNPWNGKTSTEKGAHPNSRFTAPAKNCPCISPEFENPAGVPISALVFGGRRAKTAPLVYQSRDWEHGVFVGSIMASETTAAATGDVGVVRRDPMAMLPFCGYHMADYWRHWLDMGKVLGDKAPKIFNVNWFRTDDAGHFLWPGFGDNLRVLEWIMHRCFDEIEAVDTPIGFEPKAEDIDLEGSGVSLETLKGLLSVDTTLWKEEAKEISAFYQKFEPRVPAPLLEQLNTLKNLL